MNTKITTRADAVVFLKALQTALSSAIKTDVETMKIFVAGTAVGAAMLLYGNRGSGKSSLVEALARTLGLDEVDSAYRVNGSFGMTEGQVTAEYDISKLAMGKKVVEVSKFVEAAETVALFDEIDKANPYVLHNLLTLLAEGIVKLGTFTRKVKMGAFFATMNPVAPGSFSNDLSEPLADRFDARIVVPEPEGEDLCDALMAKHGIGVNVKGLRITVPVVGSVEDLAAVREVLWKEITISEEALKTAGYFVRATQFCPEMKKSKAYFATGSFPAACGECKFRQDTAKSGRTACYMSQSLSMRVADSALLLARGIAAIDGRSVVTPLDVKEVFPYVLAHRVKLTEPPKGGDADRAVREFTRALETASADAIRISTNPAVMSVAELDAIKKQGNPMVVEAAKRGAKKIEAAAVARRAGLSEADTAGLIEARKMMGENDQVLIGKMLDARRTVKVTPVDSEEDPFFRRIFATPEGAPLFSNEEWENLLSDGNTTGGLTQVSAKWEDGVFSVTFGAPEEADTFRKACAGQSDTVSVKAVYDARLVKEMDKAGYNGAPGATAPNATVKPEVNAFSAPQTELF